MRPAADPPPHDENLAGAFGIPEWMPFIGRQDFHSKEEKTEKTKNRLVVYIY